MHLDQVLEYNEDPTYLRDLLVYQLTVPQPPEPSAGDRSRNGDPQKGLERWSGRRHQPRAAHDSPARTALPEHAEAKERPSSVADDRRMLEKYIEPAFGSRRVLEVRRAESPGFSGHSEDLCVCKWLKLEPRDPLDDVYVHHIHSPAWIR